MRFKFILSTNPDKNPVIPINYQYELAAWIYKTLHLADPEFSEWLHERGYSYQNKRFKLFTFSGLKVPQRTIQGDRLYIQCQKVEMQVSVMLEESVRRFITGIFQGENFSIGDRYSQANFRVHTVEYLPPLEKKEEYVFETISPICITKEVIYQGKPSMAYLSPEDKDYSRLLFENLIFKLRAAGKEQDNEHNSMRIEVLSQPKEKLIRIKAHTQEETFIKAYQYKFRLKVPYPLAEAGFSAGFGIKNSLGFGCVREV